MKVDTNKSTENYLNNLLIHNFLPTLLLPTRITQHSATLIDHIYFYQGQSVKDLRLSSGNIFSDLSDHLPNFAILSKISVNRTLCDRPLIRLYTDKNKHIFQQCLVNTDWGNLLYLNDDVNDCYNIFISTIKNYYEQSFPLTRMSRRASKDKKWITTSKGLKISIKHKNKLYEKWILTKNPTDEIVYKTYKKYYEKIAYKAEVAYYNNQFDLKSNTIKKLWVNLNNVCSAKKKKSYNVIDNVNIDGRDISDPNLISNAFNDYFCSVGNNLVNNLPVTTSVYNSFMQNMVSDSIFVESVNEEELLKLIDSMKDGKSCGADNISPRLIKENKSLLCQRMMYIFNLSLMKGVVPSNLKIAKVIPIFKKGDAKLITNYRPISLLSIFNKLLEKLVYKRLDSFISKHNILYKYQFGFRKNHSTSQALIEVIDSCCKNFDANKKMIGIYFDLQKAFDTVNHDILLHKLYNYGIRGVMHDWISDYLHNRKQFTVVNGISSKSDIVTCGVPQGSVLGPLFFLLYINDISNAVPGDKLRLFADDTNLFLSGGDYKEIEEEANVYLKSMESWFVANKLSLNIDKTCYTIFGPHKNVINNLSLSLIVNGQYIKRVQNCKYLGVFIDQSLSWNDHVDHVYKKIIKFSSIFYRLRDVLPKHCLKMLYCSFVHPHILYGIEVYANTTKTTLNKLCKLNNKLLRILLNKEIKTPINKMYAAINTLPIPLLHEYQLLSLVHKCIYNVSLLPQLFCNYYVGVHSQYNYNTRRKCNLFIPSVKSVAGQRCSIYRGSVLWNNLDEDIKTITSIYTFV
ncbi:MAG: RNA-directed DNA polymerase [Chitinophagaceae bacterium]